MDGNIKDTPPVMLVPTPEDRPRWDAVTKELAGGPQAGRGPQAGGPRRLRQVADAPPRRTVAASVPTDGLRLHAPLSEGDGKTLDRDGGRQAADGRRWRRASPGTPATSRPRRSRASPGAAVELADAGDFEKDQGFSYGAWVKLTKSTPGGAVIARMDDQHDFRGWDLWVENDRVGAHIIHKWPDDALKVVSKNPLKAGQWNHVFVTYDGSGKAAGVKVYINGVAAGDDRRGRPAARARSARRCR